MVINNMELPDRLVKDLEEGPRSFDGDARERLRALIQGDTSPIIPKLYDVDEIVGANKLWSSRHRKWWLGEEHPQVVPGNIDVRRTLIIGHIEPDSPLALDFRSHPPCVIGYGGIDNISYWLKLASSYEAFIDTVFARDVS